MFLVSKIMAVAVILINLFYNCVKMASKQTLKLFDFKNKLISTYIRFAHFVRYSILMRKKEIVIIGNTDDPIISNLIEKLAPNNKLTIIEEGKQYPHILKQNTFSHLLIKEDNYQQIEQQLAGANINSIIVSPYPLNQPIHYDFKDQQFVNKTIALHHQLFMRNILAYRLAHKYLYTTGVVILPCSQQQFINYKAAQRNPTEAQLLHDTFCKQASPSFLEGLISAQVTHLGIVIGDRQFTALQSKSVVALVSEIWKESSHRSMIVDRYVSWASGSNLPAPGSFALFKPSTPKTKSHYVEYL